MVDVERGQSPRWASLDPLGPLDPPDALDLLGLTDPQ